VIAPRSSGPGGESTPLRGTVNLRLTGKSTLYLKSCASCISCRREIWRPARSPFPGLLSFRRGGRGCSGLSIPLETSWLLSCPSLRRTLAWPCPPEDLWPGPLTCLTLDSGWSASSGGSTHRYRAFAAWPTLAPPKWPLPPPPLTRSTGSRCRGITEAARSAAFATAMSQ
jgi:hypothetical protein